MNGRFTLMDALLLISVVVGNILALPIWWWLVGGSVQRCWTWCGRSKGKTYGGECGFQNAEGQPGMTAGPGR